MTKTIVCEMCKKEVPRNSAVQKYCDECRAKAYKARRSMYDEHRRKRRRVLKVKPLPKKTIPDMVRDILAYNKKHGTHLTYGQYVGKLQTGTLKD